MALMEPAPTRTCLIVLGMHRSGTSVLSGTLGLLGAELPADLAEATPFNAKGHFESKSIFRINEEMLRALGTAWYDLCGLSPTDLSSIAVEKAKVELKEAIQGHYGDASLLVLKDPRFCRIFPVLRAVIDDYDALPRIVFSFRNPLEVAQSLKTRDGIALPHGLGLWLRHMLDGEFHSRGLRRVFVDYADLLKDWQTTIERVERELEIVFPRKAEAIEQVEEFIDADLRHHLEDTHELQAFSESPGWIYSTYEVFRKLLRNSNDEEALRQLDLIRADFESASNFLGGALQEYYHEISELKAGQQTQIDNLRLQLNRVGSKLQNSDRKRQNTKRQLQNTRRQLQEIQHSRSWRLTTPLRRVASFVRRISQKVSDYRSS